MDRKLVEDKITSEMMLDAIDCVRDIMDTMEKHYPTAKAIDVEVAIAFLLIQLAEDDDGDTNEGVEMLLHNIEQHIFAVSKFVKKIMEEKEL